MTTMPEALQAMVEEKADEQTDWEDDTGMNVHERQAYRYGFRFGAEFYHQLLLDLSVFEALEFYASKKSYDKWTLATDPRHTQHTDVEWDKGNKARAVIAKLEGKKS
jgi:hypothetical protein